MALDWPNTLPLSGLDKLRIEAAIDQSLRSRLISDPAGVLQEHGITVPEGVRVNVVEDSRDTHTITLPPFVGSDTSERSLKASASSSQTWECTTCTTTTPICIGSLASLTCTLTK
jgi:hypothetical protein